MEILYETNTEEMLITTKWTLWELLSHNRTQTQAEGAET
jgi:hypothetical protein